MHVIKSTYLFLIVGLLYLAVTIGCSNKKTEFHLTYADTIATLINKKCVSCHYNNGPAPYVFSSYGGVKKRAAVIKAVIQSGYMPPWPADTAYTRFVDEKILSKQQIELLCNWIDNGCIAGDTSKIKPYEPMQFGSMLGKPDLVIKMPNPYLIKDFKKDEFLLMKLPYEIANDTLVQTIEYVPKQTKYIHHVNAQWLSYENNKKKNVFDGNFYTSIDSHPGVEDAYKYMKLSHDDGTYPLMKMSVSNYLPGVLPFSYPEGIGGFRIKKKGAIFLKDLHYGPSKEKVEDSSYFNVFFAKKPLKRPTMELQMGTLGVSEIVPPLVIPPNEVKTFKTQLTLNSSISLLTVNPHMHLLGKTFWAFAVQPNGDTIPLIRIKKWDFRWQYFYTYQKPVIIPKGSTIYVFGTFDNTVNNPLNPNHPPKTVSEKNGSMKTTDEMFQFIITFLPYAEGDENIILGN